MIKLIKPVFFVLWLGLCGSVTAQTLADFHAQMNGCENCHEGDAPSENGAYENKQCVSCHGELAELDGTHHKLHAEILQCANCHKPHELDVGQNPSCDYCHDDGRNP